MAERPLKRWVPDSSVEEIDLTLEKPAGAARWDQFAANEKLFGLTTDYDENIYTTKIDKSHPQYKERLAAAEKKAREIEQSATMTSHVAEERIMDSAAGDDTRDEEDKYVGGKPDNDVLLCSQLTIEQIQRCTQTGFLPAPKS